MYWQEGFMYLQGEFLYRQERLVYRQGRFKCNRITIYIFEFFQNY